MNDLKLVARFVAVALPPKHTVIAVSTADFPIKYEGAVNTCEACCTVSLHHLLPDTRSIVSNDWRNHAMHGINYARETTQISSNAYES